MKITRYINGKPISEESFKNLSIKNANAEKIISEAAKRAQYTENENAD